MRKQFRTKDEIMIEFIIHAQAGKGKAANVRTQIEHKLDLMNVEYTFHQTAKAGHATFIAEQLCKSGAKTIVAVGGDGTAHEVLNGLTNFENVTFGLIPCGTGNDFASAIGIPDDSMKALDIVLKNHSEYVDYFQCGDVRGLNIMGTGIDVDILRHYESKKHPTKFQYFKSLVHCLCHFKPYELTVLDDNGKEQHKSAFIACACNGKQFGGGIKMCPSAIPTDGALDVIIVSALPKRKIPAALVKLMKGKIRMLNETEYLRTKRLRLKGLYNIQVDGEIYENHTFDVSIVSNKLKMFI